MGYGLFKVRFEGLLHGEELGLVLGLGLELGFV